jgi:hypothetical protein
VDRVQEPAPQLAEDIDDVRYIDPSALGDGDLHPFDVEILDRWEQGRTTGFHIQASVHVNPDGTQSYAFHR